MSIRIFIIGHHATNKGDRAVLRGMLDALKEIIPDVSFSVSSSYPEITLTGLEVFEPIIDRRGLTKKGMISKVLWLLSNLLWILQSMTWAILKSYLGKNIKLGIRSRKLKLLNEYTRADIVISCGGHHLTDHNGFLSFFCQFYSIFLPVILGKKVVIYSQTIGPFIHKQLLIKFLCRFILNRLTLITVREEWSREILDNLRITKTPIYLTADAAFLMHLPARDKISEILVDEGICDSDKHLVGMSVYRSKYPGLPNPNAKHSKYIKSMAKAADYIISELNAEVVFVPMEMAYQSDDRPLAREIVQLMKYRDSVKVIDNEYAEDETMGIIGSMDLFVGAKTHSIIFALRMKVPTVCIMYHPKAKEFMTTFGQEEFVCNINTIDSVKLINKISKAWSAKKEIKEVMNKAIKEVNQRAMFNAELVKGVLE